MSPTAVDTTLVVPVPTKGKVAAPLQVTGALKSLESFELSPNIGREFPKADLAELLRAPNSDELIRDLAVTISERGVVIFRAQDNLTNDLQKELIERLGRLTGRPAESGLHIHPVLNPARELGGDDPEISTISSVQRNKIYNRPGVDGLSSKRQTTAEWHSDIAFEPFPADYSSLRLSQLPKTGGDTLFASGYEIYDKISEPYQKFLESLSVTFEQPGFGQAAARGGFELYDKPRGNAANVGTELKAIHPVVRTNPVTGWKSIFPVGSHVKHINGVTQEESTELLTRFLDIVYKNPELQVRLQWQNPNDIASIAIWDNRSAFHSATFDYEDQGDRFGIRVVGVGERPFFDPQSSSRQEALAVRNKQTNVGTVS
ncbi:TfdA family taurine dioxygenase, putative [Cordyceps militaris CM01]|uniref:TfdA family taurine dioxygenase, putative n=1 Tax=Cordyceps militaris (strain CM01) TaxID=983644 RepID=G3JRY9_CORMM|nr:TfdA family taurine dioxygenase, putative [Cordyceps militaris CM01]EGX88635.1 TfdA family taurine dioxygenase, putative [Cordyceps militaris CM01]